MTESMSIIEARNKLTSLPEQFAAEPEPGVVAVTRRGEPVLAILPWDLYESITETLDVLGDEASMATLRHGIREIAAGKAIPWEQAKREIS